MLKGKATWIYGDDVSQPKSQKWLVNYQRVQRFSNASSYLLVAGMMFCAGVIFSEVAKHFYRGFQPAYFPWLCLVTTVQGMYVDHLTKDRAKAPGVRDVWMIYFSEWVFLLIITKIVLYLARGFDQFGRDWIAFNGNPITVIFADGQFIVYACLLLICWTLSKSFARDIHALRTSTQDLVWEVRQIAESSRSESSRNIQSRVFSIGLVLMFLALASRIDAPAFVNANTQGGASYALPGLLLYFSLGMILLSQTQFALLRGRWMAEETAIPEKIGRSWMLYGSILFIGLGILAITLPTGYSLGLLDTLRYLVNLIAYLLIILYNLILFLVAWLFRPILQTMTGAEDAIPIEPLPTSVPPPVPVITPIDPSSSELSWMAVVQSILIWGSIIGLMIYAVVYGARQHNEVWLFLAKIPVLEWLARLWRWLNQLLRNAVRTAGNLYHSAVQQISGVYLPARLTARRLRFHPGKLAPREQVKYYFLALLRKGESYGLPRKINQTPNEYSEYLNEQVAELEPDLQEVTGAFLEAKYSQHWLSPDQASKVRSSFRQVIKKIRKKE